MPHHEVVYNYVEDVDPNLVCSICQSALVNPVTTASCKHTFCRDCITRALAHSPTCPIDRSALSPTSLIDTEPLVQLMLDELKVRCEAPGCSKIMERGLLLAHLRSCSQAIETCGEKECGLSMARHRLPHHRAYECFHRRMACEGCSVDVTFREAKDGNGHGCVPLNPTAHTRGASNTSTSNRSARSAIHASKDASCTNCGVELNTRGGVHRWVCAKAAVPCTYSARGCVAIVPRDELEAHLKTCPFEALSAFFIANDARFAALERKQDELRAENEGLRAQLWSMRRFDVFPLSLRDSHPPGESLSSSPLVPPSAPPAPPARRQVALSDDALRSDSSPTPSTLPSTSQTSLAMTRSTTPPSPTSVHPTSQAQPAHPPPSLSHRPEQALHIPPSFLPPASRQSYADWVVGRLPAPSAYDEDCAALRASIVHLAAGLDATERRNEVRIMTEALRMQEEVQTLRAIVSPMRMQVLSERPNSPAVSRFPHSPGILTPPATHSAPASEAGTEDDESRASIRESVVFSAQDVYPRSSSASFVSSASATPPSRWTGRPLAFPPAPEAPRTPTRRLRIGSVGSHGGFIGSGLGSSLGATILRRRESSRH